MSSSSPARIALPSWSIAAYDRALDAERKRDLYRALLFPRLVEEKMLIEAERANSQFANPPEHASTVDRAASELAAALTEAGRRIDDREFLQALWATRLAQALREHSLEVPSYRLYHDSPPVAGLVEQWRRAVVEPNATRLASARQAADEAERRWAELAAAAPPAVPTAN